MGLAGIDDITVPGAQFIGLAGKGQQHRPFQHGAHLLPLMLHHAAGVGAGGIGLQHEAELAPIVAVVHQLHGDPLAAKLDELLRLDHHAGRARHLLFGEEARQRQLVDAQQLL